MKENLGLDRPLPVQYGLFLSQVVWGGFGDSVMMGRSARSVPLERFPSILQLAGAAFLLTVILGIHLRICRR
jgi:peptide/nickel transport system permease protein